MDSTTKHAVVEHWKKLWEELDLRVVILFSLFLQILLIFSAPLRKRMSKAYITMPIWLAYLLADITANFAIGLIVKSQWSTFGPFSNPDLLAFWAPFLMVHLGGPDTITAFAVEDNELWLRHFLGLGFLCWAVAYAFFQSFPSKDLRIPTVLMFIAGLIKYTERTRSLYLASSSRFRESLLPEPDPGPSYTKFMDDYSSKIEAGISTSIELFVEPDRVIETGIEGCKDNLSDLEVVRRANQFFETFRKLIVDMIFSFHERRLSREFFLKRNARDAFKVVEVELNFIYEILHTKVVVVQSKFGYFLRLVSVLLNCAALSLFYFIPKRDFHKFDIGITYTLLLGAIALDVIAFLMVLSSDWTAVTLTKSDYPSRFFKFLVWILRVDRVRWPENSWRITQMLRRRRWSESICQFNFIHYCLNPRSKWWQKIIEFFGLTNMLDGLKYVETLDFPNELRDHIFEELKTKSEIAADLETAKKIYYARGDWVLGCEDCTDLLRWINDVDFAESLLLWHIATELCFSETNTEVSNAKNSGIAANTEGGSAMNSGNADEKDYRKLSKLLSDYMLYFLIMQSTVMSTVAGNWKIIFRDTCAEAKEFFRERKIRKIKEKNCCLNIFPVDKCFCCSKSDHDQQNQTSPKASAAQEQQEEETAHSCWKILCCFTKCCCKGDDAGPDKVQIKACNSIIGFNTKVKPVCVRGDRNKSVLFDASMLAKELNKLGEERKWKIMSKVWVELLSYAACRCRAITHAAQLSKGGQLITLVWLLIAHLGLGSQNEISEGYARAKLIVGEAA